jgi:hypothetical protein
MGRLLGIARARSMKFAVEAPAEIAGVDNGDPLSIATMQASQSKPVLRQVARDHRPARRDWRRDPNQGEK